ncbi:MAG: MarC family transcriptional regulator [Bacteroidetes bacterium]|nr:MarC family transcriptional regulator [Bacteroidota bacterium]|tara:strand:- start:198 stop:815 length:618 start_codon:yes stop_codon:yes gene_type:complete
MIEQLIQAFVVLWVVIDPIGSVPVFLASTNTLSSKERKITAFRAVLFAAIVLLFFLVLGQLILEAMDISISAFQIAGGLVLLYFGFTMIFGESKPESEMNMKDSKVDVAIFPMAVPSLASPGAMMAIVLLTENETFTFMNQFITALVMIFVLLIAWVLLLAASKIQKVIGDSGAAIISRVMGLILAAVAVDSILEGLVVYFNLNI